MPVVDQLAPEYEDEITFLAIAWKSSFDRTLSQANELLNSGLVRWGLDATQEVFALYAIPYQPHSVLIADGVIVDSWAGTIGEEELRERLDNLARYSG